MAHWCGSEKCEKQAGEEIGATIRCIPFDPPKEKGECVVCGAESGQRVVFARAY